MTKSATTETVFSASRPEYHEGAPQPTERTPVAPSPQAILDGIRGVYDALSVRRVFGDSYDVDGVTIIPVARIAGGAGGGSGEGSEAENSGSGFGSGFGVAAQPVGVYEVRSNGLKWKPAIDVNRLAKGGQVLAGIAVVGLTLIRLRRG